MVSALFIFRMAHSFMEPLSISKPKATGFLFIRMDQSSKADFRNPNTMVLDVYHIEIIEINTLGILKMENQMVKVNKSTSMVPVMTDNTKMGSNKVREYICGRMGTHTKESLKMAYLTEKESYSSIKYCVIKGISKME